jgi:asparaginyl-tRNA synthetase
MAMAPREGTEVLDPPSRRTRIRAILEAGDAMAGRRVVVVGGWVRAGREQGHGAPDPFAFLDLNDGSCQGNLQLFVKGEVVGYPLARLTATGTSVLVEGVVRREERAKHGVELAVTRVLEVGEVDAAAYPLPKTKTGHSLDPAYIRDFVHLRARTYLVPQYFFLCSLILSPCF